MLLLVWLMAVLIKISDAKTERCKSADHYMNSSRMNDVCCVDSRDSRCNIHLKCRIRTSTDLDHLIFLPKIIYSLDISKNGLHKIDDDTFSNYEKLVALNLSQNNIKHIQKKAFVGLTSLEILDLSYNSLLTWNTLDITSQLPSLTELNVIGNPSWLPGQHIRDLPNITAIKGIASYTMPYLDYCIHCDLHKQDGVTQSTVGVVTVPYKCSEAVFLFHKNLTALYSSFEITCKVKESETKNCKQSSQANKKSSLRSAEVTDLCFYKINRSALHNIPIGLVAMVINLVVLITVASSPSLRRSVNMFLMSHMAVGDFLLGLWLVTLTLTRRYLSRSEFYQIKSTSFCYVLFGLLVLSESLSILVSFLVTFERYFCVIYSTKPDIRITLNIAKILISFIWAFVIMLGTLPMTLGMKASIEDYSCSEIGPSNGLLFLEYLGFVAIIIYAISYILYARIFYKVRQAGLNVGIQREGRLAKRILVVVSTNLFFLLCPIISWYMLTFGDSHRVWIKERVYWNLLVISCFGINSCVNPILYAFRNELFQSELRRLLKCRRNVVLPMNSTARNHRLRESQL